MRFEFLRDINAEIQQIIPPWPAGPTATTNITSATGCPPHHLHPIWLTVSCSLPTWDEIATSSRTTLLHIPQGANPDRIFQVKGVHNEIIDIKSGSS